MQRISTICLLATLLVATRLYAAPEVQLKPGMTIKESVTVSRGQYSLNAATALDKPLIIIEGKNIVVDFNQAVLQGSNGLERPDLFYGLAVLIKKGSKNITIRNAHIHGYKVAILADSVLNLAITNCDFSYNWREQLHSNREREDERDWMSYHHNENDEWLRYGAGMYLKHCNKAVISGNIITGGQCALMMTNCEAAEIYDNDFCFNSGIGIGLYRSSNNKIYHNRLDWNVRGYSYGKYKRGQDSAGILVFEQCNNNVFAYNSATHSGDGFFLWAGQTTMDTGKGGCNDNFIYGNDFSYAPTNGVEITFSRNLVMKNKIHDCDHGVWGGYSFDTDITDNDFADNRIGIAIEHGQGINIAINSFRNDKTGIRLWSRAEQPADWKYPQLRNTRSMNYWIAANKFTGNATIFDIMGTDSVAFSGNHKEQCQAYLKLGERTDAIDTSRDSEQLELDYEEDARLKNIKPKQLPVALFPQGKEQIRITEWGPYDFRYPLLWLSDIDSLGQYHFDVLGPNDSLAGQQPAWEIEKLTGFEIVRKGNAVIPSAIIARPVTTITEQLIRLQYKGPAYTNAFGKKETADNAFFEYRYVKPWVIKQL